MSSLSRRCLLAALPALVLARPLFAATPHPADAIPVEMWKITGCGCCTAWAKHLEGAGFAKAVVHELSDLAQVRAAAGVPAELAGCHTAKIGGYVIEGHVPATAIRRLLAEKPAVLGLAVPGMPVGSPGMEVPGQPAEPYDVVAFARDGQRYVFMPVRA